MGWCQGPCSGSRFGGRISAPSSLGDPHNKHYRLLLSYIDYTHMHTTHTHTCTHIPPPHTQTYSTIFMVFWLNKYVYYEEPSSGPHIYWYIMRWFCVRKKYCKNFLLSYLPSSCKLPNILQSFEIVEKPGWWIQMHTTPPYVYGVFAFVYAYAFAYAQYKDPMAWVRIPRWEHLVCSPQYFEDRFLLKESDF